VVVGDGRFLLRHAAVVLGEEPVRTRGTPTRATLEITASEVNTTRIARSLELFFNSRPSKNKATRPRLDGGRVLCYHPCIRAALTVLVTASGCAPAARHFYSISLPSEVKSSITYAIRAVGQSRFSRLQHRQGHLLCL
jgi:hypothetical protein